MSPLDHGADNSQVRIFRKIPGSSEWMNKEMNKPLILLSPRVYFVLPLFLQCAVVAFLLQHATIPIDGFPIVKILVFRELSSFCLGTL